MILAKKRCIYCSPESWEKMRRRAKKDKTSISRLVIRCCRQAASAGAPREPPGHSLVLSEATQRSLYEDSRALARLKSIVIDVEGGGKVTLAMHEAMRILLLCEGERG
ncbi:MAG: hypothetical protein OXI75_14155 [Rhodospirillales bacterium]|nr:hypothetical protein [Rhodospirillales bacterium]